MTLDRVSALNLSTNAIGAPSERAIVDDVREVV